MKDLLREVGGYAVASLFALLIDFSLLWMLVSFFQLPFLAAASLSFLAGATVAYHLSVRLAFKRHRLGSRSAEFASFVVIGTLGLAVNASVMQMAVKYWGLHYLLAKAVAASCTFTCNFIARRQLLFIRPRLATRD